MIYMLDVNALVALGFLNHEFHDRVVLGSQLASANGAIFATLDENVAGSYLIPK
jgi:hypothetical protein